MMANNRLYLKCNQCGEYICIGKHFCGSLYTNLEPEEFGNMILDFYEKHSYCLDSKYHPPLHYYLELCEEFPGEMTENPYDERGEYWDSNRWEK